MLKRLSAIKHHEQHKSHYIYNDKLTQLSYEIMFNSNKNLLFNYSYYIRNAASISSLCI